MVEFILAQEVAEELNDWHHLIAPVGMLLGTLNLFLLNKLRKDNKPDVERLTNAVDDKRNNLPEASSETVTLGNLATGLLEEMNRMHERLDLMGVPPGKDHSDR